jgi:hypothetical protein
MRRVLGLLHAACVIGLATGCRIPSQKANTSFYPIGIYGVPSTNDFASLREAGFNLVVGRAERPCLDAARAAGLMVLAAPGTSAGPGFNPAKARKTVKQFDHHPALWAWYVVDEPDLNDIPPEQVHEACRQVKAAGARKPTALVLQTGHGSLHYGNMADITMIDRYPIPWLPLANFGQHVTMTRLAVAKGRPLLAVIQAFDWSSFPEMLPGEENLRPPTYAELRCMTYEALARRANGLFYYSFDDSRWKIRDQPETWEALKAVVKEVNERLPLFVAKPQWWVKNHKFSEPAHRFNAALESSVTSTLLRVGVGNDLVPPGDYVLAVNNTERSHEYSFTLPPGTGSSSRPGEVKGRLHESKRSKDGEQKAQGEATNTLRLPLNVCQGPPAISVLGENRAIEPVNGRLRDSFAPYGVHVYGPLR